MTRTGAPLKLKEGHDGPTPSGNSVAVMNLLRLAELTGQDRLKKVAARTLDLFRNQLDEQPTGYAYMMAGVDLLVNGMREIVVVVPGKRGADEMSKEIASNYIPDSVVVVADEGSYESLAKATTLLKGRPRGSRPIAYVCKNNVCQLPANSVEELKKLLRLRQ